MPGWIKLTLGLVLALLLLVVAAAAIAPALVDKQQLLRDLEAEVSLALGRPTQFESIEQLRLLPTPRLRLQGLRVSETAAAEAPVLATVESLQLDAAIWPLVTGRLVLAEVLLDRPKLTLQMASAAPSTAASTAASHLMSRGGEHSPRVLVGAADAQFAAGAGLKEVSGTAQEELATTAPMGQPSATSVASPPAMPPIRRLMIRDGELIGPATTTGTTTGTTSMLGLAALNLTAGPIAPGRSGRLDAAFKLFTPMISLPGLVEAEIRLADPLTEVALRSLRLRFGRHAGGQGPPIEIDAEARFDLMNTRLSIDPFELLADRLQITGAAQLFPTPSGLGIDGQVRVPPFDLRAWLVEQTALTTPGNVETLRRVGGQFDLQLRGFAAEIDNAALIIDQAQLTAVARLRLPQGPLAPFSGRLAVAIDRLDLDPYLAGAEPISGPASRPAGPPAPAVSVNAAPALTASANPVSTVPPAAVNAVPAASAASLNLATTQLPPLPPLPLAARQPEQGLRLQLAAGELRLGGLGLSSTQLTGHLLPRSLEFDSNADFYGGRLETQFAASQLAASAPAPQPGREPDSALAEDKASPRPGPGPGPGSGSGSGSGSARALDAPSAGAWAPGPDLRLEATASGVDLAALLSELQLGGHNQVPITGLAEIDLDLLARGADSASILSTLGGEAAFAVRDGAVTMVDLGQLITGTIGAIGVSREDAENLTRFHALTLSAKGAEGRFSSDDIQLRSNLLNIDGRGELDLSTQQIALNLQAVMTKPPKGQGRGIKELEGIPIPISASGPWADPRWEVDVRSALDTAARRALREDNGLFDEIEERTGIKGLGDGLRQILPGLLGR
ncbi:AsmA family protein [Lamprobacter modestohalophilus]|uniref:AsmA family protein n=1 Tax=Lamprobacter modestohalophilus TaxID=1064514 RepID=UPI002ADED89C|nr:AsmA family protein [Lamprobacter modestohalophilus]MEA1048458.1 AsmA family protein [Lamprobacter modestohalophilus]